jgi:hypothetical protein
MYAFASTARKFSVYVGREQFNDILERNEMILGFSKYQVQSHADCQYCGSHFPSCKPKKIKSFVDVLSTSLLVYFRLNINLLLSRITQLLRVEFIKSIASGYGAKQKVSWYSLFQYQYDR